MKGHLPRSWRSLHLVLTALCAVFLLERVSLVQAASNQPLWRLHSPSKRSHLPRLSLERKFKRSTVPETDVERPAYGNQTAAVIYLQSVSWTDMTSSCAMN